MRFQSFHHGPQSLTAHIAGSLERFTFFHIAETDYAGHSGGWTFTPGGTYWNAVKAADAHLGAILDAILARGAPEEVAILLTADHGGGGVIPNGHSESDGPGNYTIPMFISAPGFPGGTDLIRTSATAFLQGSPGLITPLPISPCVIQTSAISRRRSWDCRPSRVHFRNPSWRNLSRSNGLARTLPSGGQLI